VTIEWTRADAMGTDAMGRFEGKVAFITGAAE
jgi:hypothetical protein